MRQGLKRVAHRRDDALTEVRWDRLEHLLAAYYREAGYQVEHVGTGASAGRFDGGVDLRLQRAGRVVLVQVKHWNAYKVPHNEVHQLIGLMFNARADAAILVTSGEFTKAAIEAATRNGLVQLIDGDELRAMLGPLPEVPVFATRTPDSLAAQVGEHLMQAAMGRALPAGRKATTSWAKATAMAFALKCVVALAIILIGYQVIQANFYNFGESLKDVGGSATTAIQAPSSAPPFTPSSVVATMPAVPDFCIERDRRTGAVVNRCAEHAARPKPSLADVRESQRKANAAMEVLRASTPEM